VGEDAGSTMQHDDDVRGDFPMTPTTASSGLGGFPANTTLAGSASAEAGSNGFTGADVAMDAIAYLLQNPQDAVAAAGAAAGVCPTTTPDNSKDPVDADAPLQGAKGNGPPGNKLPVPAIVDCTGRTAVQGFEIEGAGSNVTMTVGAAASGPSGEPKAKRTITRKPKHELENELGEIDTKFSKASEGLKKKLAEEGSLDTKGLAQFLKENDWTPEDARKFGISVARKMTDSRSGSGSGTGGVRREHTDEEVLKMFQELLSEIIKKANMDDALRVKCQRLFLLYPLDGDNDILKTNKAKTAAGLDVVKEINKRAIAAGKGNDHMFKLSILPENDTLKKPGTQGNTGHISYAGKIEFLRGLLRDSIFYTTYWKKWIVACVAHNQKCLLRFAAWTKPNYENRIKKTIEKLQEKINGSN
jgi:hypothetical protein